MPQSRWFKGLFAALFISGAWLSVGCVAANAPTEQSASPAGAPPATVLQIMNVLTSPASEVVFSSVQTVASERGVENVAPKDDQEWQKVVDNAVMMAESANLLLTPARARDQGDWVKMTNALIEASVASMKAASAKDAEALNTSFDQLYSACEDCHMKYSPR